MFLYSNEATFPEYSGANRNNKLRFFFDKTKQSFNNSKNYKMVHVN